MKHRFFGTLLAALLTCVSLSPSWAQEPISPAAAGDSVAEVFLGAIAPDGRFFSYTDWSTGDLAVRNLETGKSRRLTKKGTWDIPEFAQAVQAISPDGRHIAYGWQSMTSCDLRTIDLDGSERVIYRDDETANVLPHSWSPDGRHILATFSRKDGTDQMMLVSVADGAAQVLKGFDAAGGSDASNIMAFSPDGRFVAYDVRSDPESSRRDIRVLSIDGIRDSELVTHAANDFVLGWAPGGWVLFASDRQGSLDAWAIQVEDGRPLGQPRRVRSHIPPIDWGMFARDGSYYYSRVVWMNDVYLTELDPETGKAGSPYKLIDHVGFNTAAEWSRDGRLAYASGHGRYPDPFTLGILSPETGEHLRFSLEMTRLGGHAFEPHWSPDGDALLGSGQRGIRHIDARTGRVSLLVGSPGGCPGGGDCIEWPVWAADNRAVFTRFDGGVPRRIFARDVESGLEEELYRVNPPAAVSQLAVSPDGRRLAFVWSDTESGKSALRLMRTSAGSEPQDLIALPRPSANVPFDSRRGGILRPAWSPDGGYILFTTIEPVSEGWGSKLWRIPSGGGAAEFLGLLMEGLRSYGLSVHPDGRRIAITAGTPRREETWVMRDLLAGVSVEDRSDIQPISDSMLVGRWQGFVLAENGTELRVEIDVNQRAGGELAGSIDLRDTGALDIPAEIDIAGRAVSVTVGPETIFLGQLQHDQRSLAGLMFWSSDSSWHDLVLERDNEAFRAYEVPRLARNGEVQRRYSYEIPREADDGWPVSSLAAERVDESPIRDLVEHILREELGRPEAILISRNGKLVLEEYFYGFSRARIHAIQSITKSVTSLLFGMAYDLGLVGDLDEPVYGFFPDRQGKQWIDQQYPISLFHLLTMSAAVAWSDENYESSTTMNRSGDWIGFVLSLDQVGTPGRVASYNSGLSILLGGVLQRATGERVDLFAERTLFTDLNVSGFRWRRARDGTTHTGGGLSLTAFDLAKLGQLVLDRGTWQGRRVISESWIAESTERRLPLAEESDRATGESRYSTGFGYHWWHQTYEVNGEPVQAIAGMGYGGQYLGIFPELDAVVVLFNGEWAGPTERTFNPNVVVEEWILPAFFASQ